jgi:hypothetical protein
LSKEVLLLLQGKGLGESVGRHVCCGHPFNANSLCPDFLAKPMAVNVHMPEFGLEFDVFLLEETNGLPVVAVYAHLFICIEVNSLKEALPS